MESNRLSFDRAYIIFEEIPHRVFSWTGQMELGILSTDEFKEVLKTGRVAMYSHPEMMRNCKHFYNNAKKMLETKYNITLPLWVAKDKIAAFSLKPNEALIVVIVTYASYDKGMNMENARFLFGWLRVL